MFERVLVPVYLPSWIYKHFLKVKRTFVPPLPPAPTAPAINISGERNVEWSFLSNEMPIGPGKAFEFGCEHGYMSLMAAQKGFQVLANDLQPQPFTWRHPNVEFRQGDFLKLELPRDHFDLAINCSSVEHVGVAGRYGITADQDEDDIEVMKRLAEILKPGGVLLMTGPCGSDAVLAPWCRVYGRQRLPRLFAPFEIVKESYWVKDSENRWVFAAREAALDFQPRNDPNDGHWCAYALGCFVLRKSKSGASQ
jgi:SAM-dependent methyltransferase